MLDKQLYLKVHEAFIDERHDKWPNEQIKHASYDWSERAKDHQWRLLSDHLVADHLRELSNSLNGWRSRIIDLQSWAKILPNYDDKTQWAVRNACVETVSSFCLHQPYSLRERFIGSVTQILHQANLNVYPSHKDELPHDGKDKFLSSKEKLDALNKVGDGWRTFSSFQAALLRLSDRDFTDAVRNYRNLANHGIPPNLEYGHGVSVTRRLEYVDDLVKREDGAFDVKTDYSRKRVIYEFGGAPPLTLEQIIQAVVKQYCFAHDTLERLFELMQEICDHLPKDSGALQND
jgi:hypothetical protein